VSPSGRGLGVSPRNTSQGGRVGIDRIVFEDYGRVGIDRIVFED